MYAFVIAGDGAEAGLKRLLAELDGRVGVVRETEATGDGGVVAARGDTEYVVDDGWRASGEGLSVAEAIDRLAPDHEYAALVGVEDVDVPTIAVDGGPEDATVRASRADALDVGAARDAIREAEPHETLESLVAAVKRSERADRAGAISTFTGRVRERNGADDDPTEYLEFEKYDGVAERTMRTIERDLERREGVLDVRLHHRTGRVEAGEDIVFVVVLAGHRREAFRAVEDGINRLKDEVPLFKKEVTASETFWVHEQE
ncbi:molybdopterin synthase [Halobacteriales archaeon QS_1_68_44]|nr:MAG: molybdopterin synthase [Halobacteriales archaeon QS_1_68_44]